jgi:uncharacterized protein YndB with AHSA1/START domain
MDKGLIAQASVSIHAPNTKVWDALVNPAMISQYMFGTEVVSEWKEGSPIVWKGTWQGKSYEDKEIILKIELGKTLEYSHFSPLSGLPDAPVNYHNLIYKLSEDGDKTLVSLSQDNNATENTREHSQKMWESLLSSLKKLLEES